MWLQANDGKVFVTLNVGADGRFHFRGLPPLAMQLSAFRDGGQIDTRRVMPGQEFIRIVIGSLAPDARIQLPTDAPIDPDAPVDAAVVNGELQIPDRRWLVVLCGVAGDATHLTGDVGELAVRGLQPGPHLVWAVSENRAPPLGALAAVDIQPGTSPVVSLTPVRLAEVRFRVVADDTDEDLDLSGVGFAVAVGGSAVDVAGEPARIGFNIGHTGGPNKMVRLPPDRAVELWFSTWKHGSHSVALHLRAGEQQDLGVIRLKPR